MCWWCDAYVFSLLWDEKHDGAKVRLILVGRGGIWFPMLVQLQVSVEAYFTHLRPEFCAGRNRCYLFPSCATGRLSWLYLYCTYQVVNLTLGNNPFFAQCFGEAR